MNATVDDLFRMIGEYEVKIRLLNAEIADLKEQLKREPAVSNPDNK